MQNLFFVVLFGFMAWVVLAGSSSSSPPLVTTPFASQTDSVPAPSLAPVSAPISILNTSGASSFRCDGRRHCSQMNSRAEAVFFVRNCPNTLMDGDNDGEPCENDTRF
tara:strand:- start:388 stop:711 length:324 start_codon:yes stop_codon:yes gene_type:complete